MKKLIFLFCSFFSVLNAELTEEVLKKRILNEISSIEGWCSKEKALNFIDLVLEVKPDVCVEIGVFGGSSIFPVAYTLKFLDHGIIIGIDPWDKLECIKYFDPIENEKDILWWGNLNLDYIHYSYMNMLKKYQLENHVTTIRKTSKEAASLIDSIDILYIDGNHSESCSIQDVMLYLPKVHTGGYIWYNDSLWIERQEALDLLLEVCETVKLIDGGNCILFKKL